MNRNRAILDFVARHRGVPTDVLHDKFFSGLSQSAASQVLARLEQADQLHSQKFNGNRKLWRLGKAAVKRYGLRTAHSRALPPTRVPVELGALDFCMEKQQHRLTPRELVRHYQSYPKQLLFKHPYYVDDDGETKRLAQIRVELSVNPISVIKKHKNSFFKCCDKYQAFRALYDNDHLMFVVVSPFERLLTALADQIAQAPWYPTRRLYHSARLASFLQEEPSHKEYLL